MVPIASDMGEHHGGGLGGPLGIFTGGLPPQPPQRGSPPKKNRF